MTQRSPAFYQLRIRETLTAADDQLVLAWNLAIDQGWMEEAALIFQAGASVKNAVDAVRERMEKAPCPPKPSP